MPRSHHTITTTEAVVIHCPYCGAGTLTTPETTTTTRCAGKGCQAVHHTDSGQTTLPFRTWLRRTRRQYLTCIDVLPARTK